MAEAGSIQSLQRAFALLEALANEAEGMQLTELAHCTGLHKSSAHRILKSLIELGYVKKSLQEKGKYALSFKLAELTGRMLDTVDVLEKAKPALQQLRDTLGETVHLVAPDNYEILYIYKAESLENSYRMSSQIGLRRPMYCTAAGKSILAKLPLKEARHIWELSNIVPYTPKTITRWEVLEKELALIQKQGFAVDNEENELGVKCTAAAIVDYCNTPIGAFSVSAPTVRLSDERMALFAKEVLATNKKLSIHLV